MNNKVFEKFEEVELYIAEKVKEKDKELIEIKKRITETEAKIKRCEITKDEAEEKLDGDAYAKAKQELLALNTSKEMYERRFEKLDEIPLVSRKEYDEIIKDVKKLADKANDEIKEKAKTLLPKFKELSIETININERTQKLLNLIEHGLGNDNDEFKRTPDGAILSDRWNGLSYKYHRPFNVVYDNIEREVNM